MGRWLVGAVAAVGVLMPFGVIAVATVVDRSESLRSAEDVWVPLVAAPETFSAPVDLALSWEPVAAVVAPAWSGTVTAVDVMPGSTLSSGQPIGAVDGVVRIAVHTDVPLHRALRVGDHGPDAAALNGFLAARGLSAGAGDVINRSTLAGIRGFATSIGIPAEQTCVLSSFEPGWIVYLPQETLEVRRVMMSVGAPAPAPGQDLIAPSARLVGAYLVPAGSMESAVDAAAGVDLAALAAVDVPSSQRVVAGGEAMLTLDGVALALGLERDEVDAGALGDVAARVEVGQGSVAATLATTAAADTWQVPAGAVFAVADGRTCLISAGPGTAGGPSTRVPHVVQVVGDAPGTTLVVAEPALAAEDLVLLAPTARDRRCG